MGGAKGEGGQCIRSIVAKKTLLDVTLSLVAIFCEWTKLRLRLSPLTLTPLAHPSPQKRSSGFVPDESWHVCMRRDHPSR